MRRLFGLFFFLLFLSVDSYPERWTCHWGEDKRGRLTVGMRMGAAWSSISNVPEMMKAEDLRPDYAWDRKMYVLPTVHLFAEYMQGGVSGEFDLGYYSQGDRHTRTTDAGLTEDYKIAYHYLFAGVYLKIYCYKGFYVGAGGRVGLNLTPDAVDYSSNRFHNYQSYDKQRQEHLRETIRGRLDFGPGILMGYEFAFGLQVEARYHYGAYDMIETRENKYGLSEQNNTTNMVELTVGYSITIFDYETGRKGWNLYKSRSYWEH